MRVQGCPPPETAAGWAHLWAAAPHQAAQPAPRPPAASQPAQRPDAKHLVLTKQLDPCDNIVLGVCRAMVEASAA